MQGFAICTAPRTGSNYLCQLLTSTGKLGAPKEYFNGHSRRIFDDPNYPDQPEAQIAKILSVGATNNGVYGHKLFYYQHFAVSPLVNWTAMLPNLKFVFLTRNDIVSQAISWAKAKQTGQYRSTQQAIQKPYYNTGQILECAMQIRQEYAAWDAYFATNGITPLKLNYEDIVKNPQAALDAVAGLVDVKSRRSIDMQQVILKVQSDSSSSDWHIRFLDEVPNLGL